MSRKRYSYIDIQDTVSSLVKRLNDAISLHDDDEVRSALGEIEDTLQVVNGGPDQHLAYLAKSLTVNWVWSQQKDFDPESFKNQVDEICKKLNLAASMEADQNAKNLTRSIKKLIPLVQLFSREERKRICKECHELLMKYGVDDAELRRKTPYKVADVTAYLNLLLKTINGKRNVHSDKYVERWIWGIQFEYPIIIASVNFFRTLHNRR